MKKMQYQNYMRKLFLEGQVCGKNFKKENDDVELVHTDWMCKVPPMRLKFLPDFETLKKPGYGLMSEFVFIHYAFNS